ncbi:hypothetical protein Q5752_003471 [Cryptotrichosporon argae]
MSTDINQLEKEINSYRAKTGTGRKSDSALESGVDESVEARFPGASVQVGGTRRGDDPAIPDEEGGGLHRATGKQTRASDFEGPGGPDDKVRIDEYEHPGDQNPVRGEATL